MTRAVLFGQLVSAALIALSLGATSLQAQTSGGVGSSATATPGTGASATKPAAPTSTGTTAARSGLTRDAGVAPNASVAGAGKGRDMIDAVQQCTQAWDVGTHVTKQRWAQLCKINLDGRNTPPPTTPATSRKR